MPKKDKHVRRNPYMQIARKIVQTTNERKSDIKLMQSEIQRIEDGKSPELPEHISDIKANTDGKQTLSPEEQIDTLKYHIDNMYYYIYTVERAFEQAVADIEDAETKRSVHRCLSLALDDNKEVPFYLLGYPAHLSEADFDRRKRIILKAVLRDIGLAPFKNRTMFRSYAEVVERKKKKTQEQNNEND